MGTLDDDRLIALVRLDQFTTLFSGTGGALVATDRLVSDGVGLGREPLTGVPLTSVAAFSRACRERVPLRAVSSGRLVCFVSKVAEARAAPLQGA